MVAHRWNLISKKTSKDKDLEEFKQKIFEANRGLITLPRQELPVIPVITPELWESEFHKYTMEKTDLESMWSMGDRFVTLLYFPIPSGDVVDYCLFHIVKRKAGIFGRYKYFLVPTKKRGYKSEGMNTI